MLAEHELAGSHETGAGQRDLSQFRIQVAVGAAEEAEASNHVAHKFGRLGEDRPPVARCPGGRPRFSDGVTVAKQPVIDRQDRIGCFVSWDLCGARHVRTVGASRGGYRRDSNDSDQWPDQ